MDLVAMYPTQFDRICNFPAKYHIWIDQNVPPVIHAHRKTPIQLKDEIKKRLDNMVSQGIIKPVTEPTKWASSLAYSRKSDEKLRICLDPKNLNKVIFRNNSQI